MRFYLTLHARDRMKQRQITEQDIEYCLNHYHTSYTDPEGNPIYLADLQGGRQIKVVVKANSVDPIVVITVADKTKGEGTGGTQA